MKKRHGFKIGLLLIALVFVISNIGVSSASAGSPFTDVSSSDEEILYLYNKGLIKGTSSTTYSPDASVTREQAATLIGRALNLNGTVRKTSFSDVPANRYSSGYIQSAVEKGIITGHTDGNFRPYETMTRGEMAYLISRAFNLTKTSTLYFSDIRINYNSGSLYTAVNKIATAGISNGTGGSAFSPNDDLTREQFAVFLGRTLNDNFKVAFTHATIDEMVSSADNLYVRKGPDTSYSALGKIHKGDRVQVYGYSGNWVYGKSGSYTGFISMAYLNKVGEQDRKSVV